MGIDEKGIADRGAAAINAAIAEWQAGGRGVASSDDLRRFAIFIFSKGAAYGVEETRRIAAEAA